MPGKRTARVRYRQRCCSCWTSHGKPQRRQASSGLVAARTALTRAETIGGRSELLAWAAAVRSAFADFELSVQVGPILGVYLIAGRWELTGIVRSGGHWGPSGTVITSSGIDIVRIEGGRIAEFWVNHDSFDFTRALAAR